jgi:hypothetical protein
VTAAGLIKIKNGKLKSLSPLSGHYRPSAWLFKKFLHSLREEGADLSSVTISKSYAILIGLEAWGNVRKEKKKAKEVFEKAEQKLVSIRTGVSKRGTKDENASEKDPVAKDDTSPPRINCGHTATKAVKKEEQMRENNGLVVRLMQKRMCYSPGAGCIVA